MDWGDALVFNPATGQTVSVAEAHDEGWMHQYLYWYQAGGYIYSWPGNPDRPAQLVPWRGNWVKALVELDLIIPPLPVP